METDYKQNYLDFESFRVPKIDTSKSIDELISDFNKLLSKYDFSDVQRGIFWVQFCDTIRATTLFSIEN